MLFFKVALLIYLLPLIETHIQIGYLIFEIEDGLWKSYFGDSWPIKSPQVKSKRCFFEQIYIQFSLIHYAPPKDGVMLILPYTAQTDTHLPTY